MLSFRAALMGVARTPFDGFVDQGLKFMARSLSALTVLCVFSAYLLGQAGGQPPPVIDMHVHSTNVSPRELGRLDALNIRYMFVSSLETDLVNWATALDKARYLPALVFPCDGGRAPITGRPCFAGGTDFPDKSWLREQLKAGHIRGFGELSPQYLGIAPNDPRLEPYWELAEEFDIPAGVHMGPGPPGAAYESSPVPFKSPAFRMAFADPLLLEEVLLRHKRLRLFVMHAGWPRLESMVALLYAHPNVYVDVAALSAKFILLRSGYYRYLRGLVEGGFARRIMFGSDFPNEVGPGIAAILGADFLSEDQRFDILCGNASRFLRLTTSVCGPAGRIESWAPAGSLAKP